MLELITERLVIRPFTEEDDAFVLQLLNEPDFIRHIADKGVRSREDARAYLRSGPMASYAQHGFGLWRVGLRSDDTAIGMAGLIRRDWLDAVDIGYAFLSAFAGQGYAYEAAAAVLAHARGALQAPRVLAIVNDDNAPSIRLLRKLGFADAGTTRAPDAERELRLYAIDGAG